MTDPIMLRVWLKLDTTQSPTSTFKQGGGAVMILSYLVLIRVTVNLEIF